MARNFISEMMGQKPSYLEAAFDEIMTLMESEAFDAKTRRIVHSALDRAWDRSSTKDKMEQAG